jgi:hypothetical protein
VKQNDEETFNLQGSFPNLLQNTPEKIKYDAVTCTLNLFEAEPRAIGHRQLRKVQSSSHDLDMVSYLKDLRDTIKPSVIGSSRT